MPLFEIKHRFNGSVLLSLDCESLKLCVEAAAKSSADLRYADLASANLRSANLRSADLTSADLTSADLTSADLTSADLRYADLASANLAYANLRFANLRSANLRSADLTSADLRYADLASANLAYANLRFADLTSADLTSANLTSANLRSIRDDLWAVLSSQPNEVRGLRAAVIEGRVDGSTYQGDCACLVGTIANVAGCRYDCLPNLCPDSSRPAEIFFLDIKRGDTPDTNERSKLALEWIDAWPPLQYLPTEEVAEAK